MNYRFRGKDHSLYMANIDGNMKELKPVSIKPLNNKVSRIPNYRFELDNNYLVQIAK